MTVLNAQECDIEPLTTIEENALRYAAGYVCKNVARIQKKSSPSIKEKEDLIHCMDQLKDDGQSETQCDSSIWIDAIDRGGLWRVNDTVFPVFYAMEEDVRRNIKHKSISQVSLNVAALHASIGNQDVLFYLSIAAAQFDEKEAELLLEKNHRFVDYC